MKALTIAVTCLAALTLSSCIEPASEGPVQSEDSVARFDDLRRSFEVTLDNGFPAVLEKVGVTSSSSDAQRRQALLRVKADLVNETMGLSEQGPHFTEFTVTADTVTLCFLDGTGTYLVAQQTKAAEEIFIGDGQCSTDPDSASYVIDRDAAARVLAVLRS